MTTVAALEAFQKTCSSARGNSGFLADFSAQPSSCREFSTAVLTHYNVTRECFFFGPIEKHKPCCLRKPKAVEFKFPLPPRS
ncbi:MAG: hypothetical protein BJ554DRAFT_5820 [Olpidium bornovanus]|uniref:Uncharacterized protein n=1 Tax=Olpidium bornovanus TaxID=278681 RepID=A0A8H8DL74_9FUNG|nr:MAG: hypothetical protein BJ554DRAFT_5820 [Olpidium bornovanus]